MSNKKFIKDIERLMADLLLREHTERFWHLQLTFLEMDDYALKDQFKCLVNAGLYKMSKHTYKFVNASLDKKGFNLLCFYTEQERQCLATHLALQYAGIEE